MSSIPPTFLPPAGFRYDVSEWPICVTIRALVPTDEAYAEHLRILDSMLARGEKQVHLLDTEGQNPARPSQIKMQAAWNDRSRDALTRCCLGVGMVIRSPLQRVGMGTMLAMMKQPVPYQVFGSREAAMVWARKILHKHQVATNHSLTG